MPNYIFTKDKINAIPEDTEFFAALVFSSVYVPGDERSQMNPGHGYPAHNEPTVELIVFKNVEEMKTWVAREHEQKYGSKTFQIVKMTKPKVRIATVVAV